jgi:L-2-hydroxyglutarate oxidase LhgO
MEQVECVVVGAGVIGLAVARALAQAGREVLVLEAANAIGTGISARSSEVIHAGIYYSTHSLKARLCVQGKALLYDYCAQRGIGHQRCGKLIVATHTNQVAQLQILLAQAKANGVHDLVLLDRAQALALEPELQCVAALYSPSTGTVDSHGLMLALQADLENAGGLVVFNTTAAPVRMGPAGIELRTHDGTALLARQVVNAAGLQAPAWAGKLAGLDPQHVPQAYFAKGNYFGLSGRVPFRHLIYPVPQPGGLGVHLTLDLAGQARFGPDVQWVDSADDLAVDAAQARVFEAQVRQYWPGLPAGALVPAYAGIRPKISAPGQAACDFLIQGPAVHGVDGLVNLFGMESPGLTSSLAIAEHVQSLLRLAPGQLSPAATPGA